MTNRRKSALAGICLAITAFGIAGCSNSEGIEPVVTTADTSTTFCEVQDDDWSANFYIEPGPLGCGGFGDAVTFSAATALDRQCDIGAEQAVYALAYDANSRMAALGRCVNTSGSNVPTSPTP